MIIPPWRDSKSPGRESKTGFILADSVNARMREYTSVYARMRSYVWRTFIRTHMRAYARTYVQEFTPGKLQERRQFLIQSNEFARVTLNLRIGTPLSICARIQAYVHT